MDNLNKAHLKIISILQEYDKVSYHTLLKLTGMSRSGLRGRISEIRKLGYNINKERENNNIYLSLNEDNTVTLKEPVTDSVKLETRNKNMTQFSELIEFINELKQSNKNYKPNSITNTYNEYDKTRQGVLLLSDIHVGQETSHIPFNDDIARYRLEQLTEKTLTYLKDNNIKKLNILMLGDIIEGDMIFKNQTFSIKHSALEQVRMATRFLSNMFNEFLLNGIQLEVTGVRGNHGITNYKNIEEDNWDNVVYAMLDIIFNDKKNIDFYYINKSESLYYVGKRKILLTHGENFPEQIKTSSGLKEFRGKCSMYKLDQGDIIVAGHYHTFGIEHDQDRLLIRNGALSSVSEYAVQRSLYSTPEQTLLLFNNTDIVYPIIIPIELE